MKSSLAHFYDRQITPIQSQYAEIVIYHVCLIYEANKVSRCLLRYAGYVRVLRVTICVSNCFFVDPRIFSPLPNLLSSIRLYTFKVCHFTRVLMRDGVCDYGSDIFVIYWYMDWYMDVWLAPGRNIFFDSNKDTTRLLVWNYMVYLSSCLDRHLQGDGNFLPLPPPPPPDMTCHFERHICKRATSTHETADCWSVTTSSALIT